MINGSLSEEVLSRLLCVSTILLSTDPLLTHIASKVYGPGNIRNVHIRDEELSLEDLRKGIEVMALGLCEFLGVD
jgi:hypothetical protein